jgi:single-strand DNA-binding protein
MSANNTIVIIGRVGKDPETRTIASGKAVAKFAVAVRRPGKDRDGQEVTDWFSVDLWGKQAELAGDLVRKGTLLSVAGACHIDEWTDQSGNRQKMVKVSADSFQLLEAKGSSGDGPPAPQTGERQRRPAAPAPSADTFFDDSDIPPF